ncbi:MAG: DUF4384 domain-containing protein [Gemmatimonadota bacterium]
MHSTLLIAAALVVGPGLGPAPVPPAVPSDTPAVQIRLNHDGRYRAGDRVKVQVRIRDDGYLLVLHIDAEGRLRVLFPLNPGDDSFVRGGHELEIRGRGDRSAFAAAQPGRGTVYAAVSSAPFQLAPYTEGGQWDLRALDRVPASRDVEAELNDFVRGMATTHFDYDLLRYDVAGPSVAGAGRPHGGWAYRSYAPRGGTQVFIGFGFGFAHRGIHGFHRVH